MGNKKNIYLEEDCTGHRLVLSEGDVPPYLRPTLYQHLTAYNYCKDYVAGKDILDVGCGTGYGSNLLAKTAKSVTAVDLSDTGIAIAKDTYHKPNLTYKVMDASDLSYFKDKTFDLVYSSQCIEHVVEYERFVSEVIRVLKDDGIFIVTTPNADLYVPGVVPFHYKEFTADELKALLSIFFRDVKMYGVFGDDKVMNVQGGLFKFGKFLTKVDFMNLRNKLPKGIYIYLYQKMLKIAKSGLFKRDSSLAESITTDSFWISDKDIKNSLDLLGVCKKARQIKSKGNL